MPAGTIKLTNNSATVEGSGTSFNTELKANDFIITILGGVTYTLGVKSVESATSATLIIPYTGETAGGLAWNALPNAAQVSITAQTAADTAKAIRGLNTDKANWQKIFSNTSSVTVNLPDGSTYTGPSWGYLTAQYDSKADKSALGNAAGRNVGTTSGTVAAGDDSRITGALPKSGGTVTGSLAVNGNYRSPVAGFTLAGATGANNDIVGITGDGNTGTTGYVGAFQYKWYNDNFYAGITRGGGTNIAGYALFFNGASTGSSRLWSFNSDGNASSQGQWINGSDERHKSNIKTVENALAAVNSWRGSMYDIKDNGRVPGLIAQDIEKWCPEAIKVYGDRTFSDGTVIKNFKYLDTTGVISAYHTEAIKSLFSLVELALTDPDLALKHIDEIKASMK